ncbi:ATP-binding protein [Chitinophagaceae bacterium 26-R-25]|nr:ATP-binding protein [Chitinophagaceae bacterium 26-R-25]
MNSNPFVHDYFIGYVNQVLPQYIKVHFPSSVLLKTFTLNGEQLNGGLVGNFVVIEGQKFGFLGKILELALPEKERLHLSEQSFQNKDFHPTGKIEILLSFDLFEPTKIDKGLNSLPAIGAKVFVCTSDFIKTYFKHFGVKEENIGNAPLMNLGCLTYDKTAQVQISQQAVFGRHCAVVGTTGGGKSYTLCKLIEEVKRNTGKSILIDATGEYKKQGETDDSFDASVLAENSFFHYTNLTTSDLFVLLRPSGQVQAPKLLEAIKSLKILRILEEKCDGDFIIKEGDNYSIKITNELRELIVVRDNNIYKMGQLMRPFNRVYKHFIEDIEGINSNFDIKALSNQIAKECVYDVDFNSASKWGAKNDSHLNNCISLILRITNLINNKQFNLMFGFEKRKEDEDELIRKINTFLGGDKKFFRIGFEKIGFEFQSREILANAIGKFLLDKARTGCFKTEPIILFIDEAHQYLNKDVKDEYFEQTKLSSFDSIAKECRKFGLFLCIATQMPRDIPTGTLSQMGTFIVHRLINHFDKESISSASSSAGKNSLDFLPALGAGEAILMGVDFPMPVMLKIDMPNIIPDSGTPLFKII